MEQIFDCPECKYTGEVTSFDVVTRSPLYHDVLGAKDGWIDFERRADTDSPDDSTARLYCPKCDHEFIPDDWQLASS